MDEITFKCKVLEETFSLSLPQNTTIENAKIMLESLSLGVKNFAQKWIFQGRILKDAETLQSCGIKNDNCINVMRIQKDVEKGLVNNNDTSINKVLPEFDRAMRVLLTNSEESCKEAVILLLKIITKIIENPMDEKFRKLKASNSTFNTKITNIHGGSDCMRAIGFQLIGEYWVLEPTMEAWNVLLACQQKLDKFMSRCLEALNATNNVNLSSSSVEPPLNEDKSNIKSSLDEIGMANLMQSLLLQATQMQLKAQGKGLEQEQEINHIDTTSRSDLDKNSNTETKSDC